MIRADHIGASGVSTSISFADDLAGFVVDESGDGVHAGLQTLANGASDVTPRSYGSRAVIGFVMSSCREGATNRVS